MNVCEEYVCLQGEGQFVGKPSYMIRTTGCNLRCAWKNVDGSRSICDTPFSSYKPEKGYEFSFDETLGVLKSMHPNVKHVVITGGEPTLQEDLIKVVGLFVENGFFVTVETNGTRVIDLPVQYRKSVLFSFSPKLSNSYNQKKFSDAKIHDAGNKNMVECMKMNMLKLDPLNYQLKFVISSKEDIASVLNFLGEIKGSIDRVWLMAQGITNLQLRSVEKWLVDECIVHGFSLSSRMHVNIFGKKRGV